MWTGRFFEIKSIKTILNCHYRHSNNFFTTDFHLCDCMSSGYKVRFHNKKHFFKELDTLAQRRLSYSEYFSRNFLSAAYHCYTVDSDSPQTSDDT